MNKLADPHILSAGSLEPRLRAASPDLIDAIASVWHLGWPDGHLGHVPEELTRHRGLSDFRSLVSSRLDRVTVATISSDVVGFVMVRDDELEQIYVADTARGTGLAALLLSHAEGVIADRFEVAWLAVVAGNTRARRFYARNGWSDAGAFDYPAPIEGGSIPVSARRYEKRIPTPFSQGFQEKFP